MFIGMGVLAACSSDENQLIQSQSELTEDEVVSQDYLTKLNRA